LIEKLRDIAKEQHNLTPKQIEYCNDVALDIHLRARKWDMDKATYILNESLAWVKQHEELLTTLVNFFSFFFFFFFYFHNSYLFFISFFSVSFTKKKKKIIILEMSWLFRKSKITLF